MAGIEAPSTYDGRSILTQLVPAENEVLLPPPTRARVQGWNSIEEKFGLKFNLKKLT